MSYPVVFLSFDELNADEHFEKLKSLVPDAIRVHGVRGFDSAHKAALREACRVAEKPVTNFWTVDADNVLHPKWWPRIRAIAEASPRDKVLSFRAINSVNGLCYGNGGLKLWSAKFVARMRTHENTDDDKKTEIDFCWDDSYVQMKAISGYTDPTGSAYQAFRAGFREGVKMTLAYGAPQSVTSFNLRGNVVAHQRLSVWATVGADVENGSFCCAGALAGFTWAMSTQAGDGLHGFVDYGSHFYLDMLNKYCPGRVVDLKPLIEEAKTYGLVVPQMGPAQSRVAKMNAVHAQPSNLMEAESWEYVV